MRNSTVDICVQKFVWTYVFTLTGLCIGVELLGQRVTLLLEDLPLVLRSSSIRVSGFPAASPALGLPGFWTAVILAGVR